MILRIMRFGIAAVIFLATTMFGQSTADISGLLLAPDSHPISGALVVLHNISENAPEFHSHQWEIRTGADGRFLLNVPVGFCYDAFVSAWQFDPYAVKGVRYG